MTITAVGSAVTGSGSTLAVSPTATKDVLIISYWGTTAANMSAVSGGGVTTWHDGTDKIDTTNSVSTGMWWGVVTATG